MRTAIKKERKKNEATRSEIEGHARRNLFKKIVKSLMMYALITELVVKFLIAATFHLVFGAIVAAVDEFRPQLKLFMA